MQPDPAPPRVPSGTWIDGWWGWRRRSGSTRSTGTRRDGAGLTGGTWLARGDAAPGSGATVGPPRPLTDEITLEGGDGSFAPSAISGNRVLVAWRSRGQLAVRLAALESGRPVGMARALGPIENDPAVVGLPWAFVAVADGTAGRAYVLDPESGDVRWSMPFDNRTDQLLYYAPALVVMTGDGTTRGLDWDTGDPLWQQPPPTDRPSRGFGMVTAGGAEPLDRTRPLADDRLLQLTAGGALLVRDAATGRQLARWPGVAPPTESEYLAHDGRLYAWTRGAPFWLRVTDVDGDAATRQIYHAEAGRWGGHVVPCGTGRVCFVERGVTTTEVVAVEVASGRQLWRAAAPASGTQALPTLSPAGGRLLVSTEEGRSALLDENGRQLLGPREREAPLVWLSTGTLLTMGGKDLVAVSAVDGASRRLRAAPDGRWRCTSWTERRLVCRTEGGFRVWSIVR